MLAMVSVGCNKSSLGLLGNESMEGVVLKARSVYTAIFKPQCRSESSRRLVPSWMPGSTASLTGWIRCGTETCTSKSPGYSDPLTLRTTALSKTCMPAATLHQRRISDFQLCSTGLHEVQSGHLRISATCTQYTYNGS